MRFLFTFVFLSLLESVQGQCFITGADLSYVNEIQANGGEFRDINGALVNPYTYFADRGANMVRLRLWHSPEHIQSACGSSITYGNLTDVIQAAIQVKDQGMQLNLSIHYSDYFADPGKQLRPQAWQNLSQATLIDSIYAYTTNVLENLQLENAAPDVVSIGNETTWGFIDATPETNGFNWSQDAAKFNSGLNAVDDFNTTHGTSIKKALHVTESAALFMANEFESNGVDNYDILGVSYYPHFSPQVTLQEVGDLIQNLVTEYEKEIMIFETGFVWTTDFADDYGNFMGDNGEVLPYPISPQGQKDFLNDLALTVFNAGGTGVIYWEPAWVTSAMCDQWGQGSSYENVSLFDFNNSNQVLPAFDFFEFCSTLGLDETLQPGLKVFPNPTNLGQLTLSHSSLFTHWEFLHMSGKMIQKGKIMNNQIHLPKVSAGIYLLCIKDFKGHNQYVKKILVH